MKQKIFLNSQNDIYIYFETIEQMEPQMVLDIGMFLKRIGCVSRGAMNRCVPERVKLEGVDFFPDTAFPAWENVYDCIMSAGEFLDERRNARYGLAVLLGLEEFSSRITLQMIQKIKNCAEYVIMDAVFEQWKGDWQEARIIDLQVDSSRYYLLDLTEK